MSEQTVNLCTTDAAESLRAVVAERDREIERLKEGQSILILARDEQKRLANEYRDLWSRAALKAQASGVVDAQRLLDWNRAQPEPRPIAIGREYQVAEACARLNSSPVSAGEPVYQFQCREIGEGDWEPCDHSRYMYCQKSPEMDTRVVQVQALSVPSHGEQVREGWKLVPFEPNEAIRDAIDLLCDDHSAFEDSDAFWSYLLAATPSAGSQEQGE